MLGEELTLPGSCHIHEVRQNNSHRSKWLHYICSWCHDGGKVWTRSYDILQNMRNLPHMLMLMTAAENKENAELLSWVDREKMSIYLTLSGLCKEKDLWRHNKACKFKSSGMDGKNDERMIKWNAKSLRLNCTITVPREKLTLPRGCCIH